MDNEVLEKKIQVIAGILGDGSAQHRLGAKQAQKYQIHYILVSIVFKIFIAHKYSTLL